MTNTVEIFCSEVLKYISFKEAHPDIKKELVMHIEEKVDYYICSGLSEEDAYHKSVEEMGEPKEIGIEFNKVYKSQVQWQVVLGIVTLSVLSILGLSQIVGVKQLIYVVIGISLMGLMYKLNYRVLVNKSKILYICGIVLSIIALTHGIKINNTLFLSMGCISIDIHFFINILFVIAIASEVGKLDKGDWSGCIKTGGLILVTIGLVYFTSDISNFITTSIVLLSIFAVHLLNIYKSIKLKSKQFMVILSGAIFIITIYAILFTDNIVNILIPENRYWSYEGALLIKKYGVAVFILILLIFIRVIYSMINCSLKLKHRKSYYLALAIVIFISCKLVISLVSGLGLVSYMRVSIPFICYGGSSYLSDCIFVGLFLSMWRRRLLNTQT